MECVQYLNPHCTVMIQIPYQGSIEMVQSCLIVEWSVIQMIEKQLSKYLSGFLMFLIFGCPVFMLRLKAEASL